MVNLDKAGKYILIMSFVYIIVNEIFYFNVGLVPDESNFLFTTEKMMQGHVPYKDYPTDVKPPLNYYFLSIFVLSGIDMLFIIRFSVLIINIISTYILFLLAARLYDRKTALMCSAVFLFILSMPSLFAYSLGGDRLLVLFSIASLFYFHKGLKERKSLILSGIFLGMAILSKQTAITILVFYFIYYIALLLKDRTMGHLRRCSINFLIVMLSLIMPILIVSSHFVLLGGFNEMVHWTTGEVNNIRSHDTWIANTEKFTSLETIYTFGILSPILLLSSVAFLAILFRAYKKRVSQNERFLIILLIITSYPFILTFRYFSLTLIPMSILASLAIIRFIRIPRSSFKLFSASILAASLLVSLGLNAYSIYRINNENYLSDERQARIAEYLNNVTNENEKVYVFGYSPEIYYMSKRDPPVGFYYLYPMPEHVNATEQERTIEILKMNNVTTVVVDNGQYSKYFNPVTYAYITKEYSVAYTDGRYDILTKCQHPFCTNQ